ncbi:MAG: thiol reductant ABC exporter subunit CydC [Verrucomicrobia bacterium]|nr:thiol reductant ABC exporter subunit CydC [Verrucomicrobiota bacterium]
MTIRWALLQLRPHKLLLAAAIVLGTLTVLASIGLMSTSGYLIARAAQMPPILDLMLAIVAVRFFGIVRGAVRYGERMVSHDLTFRLLLRLRCWLYEKLEPIIPIHSTYHSGDLLSRLISDVETLQNLYLRVASPLIVAGLVTCITVVGLWLLDPVVAIILLSGLIICGLVLPQMALWVARGAGRRQVMVYAKLQQQLVDGLAGMEDMLALGIERGQEREHRRATNQLTQLQLRQARISALYSFLGSVLSWATVILSLLVMIPKIQSGEFSGLLLAAATFGVLASFEAVQTLPAAFQHLEQSSQASGRIYEVIEQRISLVDPIDPLSLPAQPSFAFLNVSFSFPGSVRPALRDVSFELPFGTRTVILGPSGAGKSTIVHLLNRFADPQMGAVLLGDSPLSAYSIQAVRAQLAVVLQRPHIFNTSIRENLLLARPDAEDSELMDALAKAGLASFVKGLPQGLGTITGSEGLRLSGGQRQRLALAQAFLKDAPVLILDEATANLDVETERRILDSVYEFTVDRTLVVITHRPEILSGADTVLTLRDGRLEGVGCGERRER